MLKKYLFLISKIIFIFLLFFFVFLFGIIFDRNFILKNIGISQISMPIQKESCILEIEKVSEIGIHGKIKSGNISIFAGKENIFLDKKNDFQIDISKIFQKYEIEIPKDAKFFASKKGKKMYEIKNSKNYNNISPENLIFFDNIEDGIKKGFKF